ncbi:hypothetical protein LJC49_04670 [Ruminococcaceae bacterium OttesenSCG-928-I18]|nr:hypothetical protein [Ruminococcaceae bacterium OttesenSCG-928-I18]
MIERFQKKNLSRTSYFLFLVGIITARLAIALCQRVFLMAGGSALDDSLMFSAAQSIVQGQWLGPYTAVSMAKSMGFSLWLALLHVLRLPYLLGNALLWLGASAFAARALRPLAPGNFPRLCLFALFALLPTSFAQFTLRVYRDSIFLAFCLLFFAGVLGLALRAREPNSPGRYLAALGAGIGLCGGFLLREDGVVLLPFAACALALLVLYAFFGKTMQRKGVLCLQCALPFVVLLGGILAFSLANYTHYGVFLVNDLSAGAFPKAYGAITAVSEGESGFTRGAPVSNEALETLCEEVPSLALLEPSLRAGPAFNGYYDKEKDAYGGSFYYALKMAAWLEGLTPDAESAQAYWTKVRQEVDHAVAEGRLKSATPGGSTLPRWDSSLLGPAVRESLSAIKLVLLFETIDQHPQVSLGQADEVQRMAEWLHSPTQPEAYEEGGQSLYFNPLQKAVFLFCDVLIWVYRILIWPLLALAVYKTGLSLARGTKRLFREKEFFFELLCGLLSLGLFLSFLLRIAVSSYMEVAAFGVGTYLLYLAGGVPALLLFCCYGTLLPTPKEAA